jgi:NADH:ubiquinone oxidoreductase subunit E
MNPEPILKIIETHSKGNQTGLIPILEDIQSEYSYLPEEASRIVAQRTSRSR